MKKTKLIVTILVILILMVGASYGISNSYEIKMQTSKTEIFVGDTVEIPVKIENINLEEGIVAFSTLLSYDENVFEKPEITKGKNWGKPNVIENLIQSTTLTLESTKENQDIMLLSFKVKEDAKLGKTKIALSKFEASDGENTIVNDGAEIQFDVTSAQKKVVDVIMDSTWFTKENITIACIISMVTLFMIVFITIYYVQQHGKKKKTEIQDSKNTEEENK